MFCQLSLGKLCAGIPFAILAVFVHTIEEIAAQAAPLRYLGTVIGLINFLKDVLRTSLSIK